jgi:hypothetical protein
MLLQRCRKPFNSPYDGLQNSNVVSVVAKHLCGDDHWGCRVGNYVQRPLPLPTFYYLSYYKRLEFANLTRQPLGHQPHLQLRTAAIGSPILKQGVLDFSIQALLEFGQGYTPRTPRLSPCKPKSPAQLTQVTFRSILPGDCWLHANNRRRQM